jgi:hypothetical protein
MIEDELAKEIARCILCRSAADCPRHETYRCKCCDERRHNADGCSDCMPDCCDTCWAYFHGSGQPALRNPKLHLPHRCVERQAA